MRKERSPSALKPFISTLVFTPAVLNTSEVYPLLGVNPNADLNDFRAEFFAPLRIIWVKV